MRTLVATVMTNHKGNEIYCWNRKVNSKDSQYCAAPTAPFWSSGVSPYKLLSEYPNIAGYAIFFEGHLDEMAGI